MFTVQSQQKGMGCVPCGLYKKKVVNDRGLGDLGDKVSDLEKGYSAPKGVVGKTILPLVDQIAMQFGKATGTGLIVGMIPQKIVKSVGIDVNPLSMALAAMTFGASLLPGVSKVLGKVFGIFGGMFSHATHYGDCMKWQWNENNIRGMVSGIVPYPIDSIDPLTVLNRFPDANKEYRLERAVEFIENSSIKSILDKARSNIASILSNGVRQNKMGSIYISQVRSHPEVLEGACAVHAQSKGENMGISFSQSDIDQAFNQLKQVAQQIEYNNTLQEMNNVIEVTASAVGSVLSPYAGRMAQKIGVVQQTRQYGLVAGPQAFQLPIGVTGISKGGALVLTPGVSSNLTITMTPTVRR